MNDSIENNGSLTLTKMSLIIFNIGQIVHRIVNLIWCFHLTKFSLEEILNNYNSTEGFMITHSQIMPTLSIIVMSNILMLGFFIICLVATIKKYRSTLMTCGVILFILTFFNIFSSTFKFSLWMIYAVMSILTILYAFMITKPKSSSSYVL